VNRRQHFIAAAISILITSAAFCLLWMVRTQPGESVHAQNSGNTGTFTTAQPAFTSVSSASSTSAIFLNIGQCSHYLSFVSAGALSAVADISLEESYDGKTNFIPIASGHQVGPGGGVLQAGGYYQNVRARLANNTGLTITATYQASSGCVAYAAAGQGTAGATAPVICDSQSTTTLPTGNAAILTTLVTGKTPAICGFTVSFEGATGAGHLDFFGGVSGCTFVSPLFDLYRIATTANTPQFLTVGTGQGSVFRGALSGVVCVAQDSGAQMVISVSYANI